MAASTKQRVGKISQTFWSTLTQQHHTVDGDSSCMNLTYRRVPKMLYQIVTLARCGHGNGPTTTPTPTQTVDTSQDGSMLSCLRYILTPPSECRSRNCDSSRPSNAFSSLLLSNFGEPVGTVSTSSSSELMGVPPSVVFFCCCSPSASR